MGFVLCASIHRVNFDFPNYPLPSILVKNTVPTRPSSKEVTKNTVITGFENVDNSLKEIVECLINVYILPWYELYICSDSVFVASVRCSAYELVRRIYLKLQTVDWLEFFTKSCVESLAKHIKLFKAAKMRCRHLQQCSQANLYDAFFDLEASFEKVLCRDEICMNSSQEKDFFRDLSEILLYTVLAPNEFDCGPLHQLLKEVLVNLCLVPLFETLCDPDKLYEYMLYFTEDIPLTVENFIYALKSSNSMDELYVIKEKLREQIDSGFRGICDGDTKQILKNSRFLMKLIQDRINSIQSKINVVTDDDNLQYHCKNVVTLPLQTIINNSIGLDYFIRFLQTVNGHGYLHCFMNLEALKYAMVPNVSPDENKISDDTKRDVMSAFKGLLEKFFAKSDPVIVKADRIYFRKILMNLNEKTFNVGLVEGIQSKMFDVLNSEKFYGTFIKTKLYLKLLSELDITADCLYLSGESEDLLSFDKTDDNSADSYKGQFYLKANITESGQVCMKGSEPFTVYLIQVSRFDQTSQELLDTWVTYRRYNDFLDFHLSLKNRYPIFNKLSFPRKKLLNNTDPDFVAKRRLELNTYIQVISNPKFTSTYPGLSEALFQFFSDNPWENKLSGFEKKFLGMVDPMRGLYSTVSSIPGNVTRGIIKISSEFTSGVQEFRKSMLRSILPIDANPEKQLSIESSSSDVPLRALLIIMDEIFDLKGKNATFRAHFAVLIRQLLTAVMGGSFNRTIIEQIEEWTSPEAVNGYLKSFRHSFWPDGKHVAESHEKDFEILMIQRVLAKAKLLGMASGELRAIVGSETARTGLLTFFEMFQYRVLNRRLLHVLLDNFLTTLFPSDEFKKLIQFRFCKSARVKNLSN